MLLADTQTINIPCDDPLIPSVLYTTAGQISASLAAFHRTIEDYDSMAKREMMKAKQEKAQMFVILTISLW